MYIELCRNGFVAKNAKAKKRYKNENFFYVREKCSSRFLFEKKFNKKYLEKFAFLYKE